MHKTLKALWLVFLLPILFGLILAWMGYIGTPTNQGTWVNPPIALSTYADIPTADHYQWTILYPCQQCSQKTALENAIATLGIKASFVQLITDAHVIDEQHFFLADPHQEIVLRYDAEQPLSVIKDLKRLLKSVAK